jgi:hypothetical protein
MVCTLFVEVTLHIVLPAVLNCICSKFYQLSSNTESLLCDSNEVDLDISAEKSKYMFISLSPKYRTKL